MEYIHYGSMGFDKEKFVPISNRQWIKPNGGFWASPVSAERSWRKWCEDEQFVDDLEEYDKCCFHFNLSDSAKVLHIRHTNDLENLPTEPAPYMCGLFGTIFLDFEALKNQGYDAIELHISECGALYNAMYGWDCDSILIMNPDIINERSLL
jgi:hypothetical protein